MAYIDYKVTNWVRVHFPEKANMKLVIDDLKNHRQLPSEGFDEDVTYETMYNTEKYLDPSENDGDSTIEVYNNNGKIIWENGKSNI